MIGQLRGIVLSKKPPLILLDVNGVGYDIHVPMSTCYAINENTEVTILTHLSIRDDAHILFGFHSNLERDLFRALIKVNGIGPKLALTILSGAEPSDLIHTIQQQDLSRLTTIPGIGKKTAERLIIETRDTIQLIAEQTNIDTTITSNSITQDALSALQNLGYKQNEAKKAITQQQGQASSAEDLIKLSLQYLMKGVTA